GRDWPTILSPFLGDLARNPVPHLDGLPRDELESAHAGDHDQGHDQAVLDGSSAAGVASDACQKIRLLHGTFPPGTVLRADHAPSPLRKSSGRSARWNRSRNG